MASNAITPRSGPETDASANARAVQIIANHQTGRKYQTVKDGATGLMTTSSKQVQHKHLPTEDELRRWVKNLRGQHSWTSPAEKHWAKKNLALQEDNTTVKWVTGGGKDKDGGIIVPLERWGAMIRDAHIKTDANGAFVHLGRDATLARLREADQDKKPKYKTPQKEIILSFIKGCPQCKEGKKRKGSPSDDDDNDDAAAAAAAAPAPPRPAKRPRRGASILACPSSSSSSSAPAPVMVDYLHQANIDPALVSSPSPSSLDQEDDALWNALLAELQQQSQPQLQPQSQHHHQHQHQHQHQQPGPDTAQHDTNLDTFQPQGVALPAPQYHGGPNMAYFADETVWWHSPIERPQQQQWQGLPVAHDPNNWAYNAQSDQEKSFTISPVDYAPAAQQEQQAFPEGTVNLEALALQPPFPWELPNREFYDCLAANSGVLAPSNAE